MSDNLNIVSRNIPGPLAAQRCTLVTPSNTVEFEQSGFVIVLGAAGNVVVKTHLGDVVTLALDPKEILPILVRQVYFTGTTATSIYLLR